MKAYEARLVTDSGIRAKEAQLKEDERIAKQGRRQRVATRSESFLRTAYEQILAAAEKGSDHTMIYIEDDGDRPSIYRNVGVQLAADGYQLSGHMQTYDQGDYMDPCLINYYVMTIRWK